MCVFYCDKNNNFVENTNLGSKKIWKFYNLYALIKKKGMVVKLIFLREGFEYFFIQLKSIEESWIN